jgi:HEPN domain-containing protein
MATWTDNDLLALDAKYAAGGVAHHARPLRAAIEILGGGDLIMAILPNPETTKIVERYRELVPEVSSTWPGLGIGVAASVDQARKVTVPVPFGTNNIEVWEALGFNSKVEWWKWCREDSGIAAETAFAAADMNDFAHGLNEIEQSHNTAALTLWAMARSNLEDAANTLPATFSVDSVIQPICMIVELSLKALLVWNGADPDSFKGPKGHDLTSLANRVANDSPHRDDLLAMDLIASLPSYVASRYSPAGLNRLKVVRLALGAQFILASTLRRVTSTDLAVEFESGGWPAPRRPF